MIFLIEGVLPEGYFANNLRGLSIDMAVFRDLLRQRLPHLSRHLEELQQQTDSSTSYCIEPVKDKKRFECEFLKTNI